MESSKIPLIMYLKKKHLPSGRKEKNRRRADGFLRAKVAFTAVQFEPPFFFALTAHTAA